MIHRMNRLTLTLVALPLLLVATGCTSSAFLKDPGKLIGRPRIERHVSRILCLWEPSQGTGLDDKPARGFSGQIMFFGGRDESAARISGDVRILVYDNYDASIDDPEPMHTFAFDANAWDVHRSEGSLGHTYSVFIPYNQKHKNVANCGVKVEYTSPDGHRIHSDTIEVLLPGKSAQAPASATALRRNITREYSHLPGRSNSVRQTSFQESGDGNATGSPDKLESMTIKLPRR